MPESIRSKLSKPVIVGLVGGVASGKSHVGRLLENRGAMRIDADQLGHAVLQQPEVRARLVEIWGPSLLNALGEVDRTALGHRVFGDSLSVIAQRRQLEAIVHPRIRALAMQQFAAARELPTPPLAIVIDAPLLLEAGWEPLCDLILFIDALPEERLRRAAARGWSEQQFADREASQLSLNEKRSRSTHILDNSQEADIDAQVSRVWRELTEHAPFSIDN